MGELVPQIHGETFQAEGKGRHTLGVSGHQPGNPCGWAERVGVKAAEGESERLQEVSIIIIHSVSGLNSTMRQVSCKSWNQESGYQCLLSLKSPHFTQPSDTKITCSLYFPHSENEANVVGEGKRLSNLLRTSISHGKRHRVAGLKLDFKVLLIYFGPCLSERVPSSCPRTSALAPVL